MSRAKNRENVLFDLFVLRFCSSSSQQVLIFRGISIFKSKCIFSTRPLVSRCVLHNDLQSNASYTNFKRDRDKNNKLGGFRCAKKTTLLSPKWGHIIFYNVSKNISICGDILKLVHFYCSVWFLGQIMQ